MPFIASRGAASSGGFGQFVKAVGIGDGNWLGTLTSANALYGWGSAVDSSGNVILTGQNNTNSLLVVVKYNSTGTIQWQRSYAVASGYIFRNGPCAVDSSGNIYTIFPTNISTAYPYVVMKLNSAGAVQWSIQLKYTGYNIVSEKCAIAVSSAGVVYVAAQFDSTQIIVSQFDTNGNNLATQTIGDISYVTQQPYIAVAASGNVYVAGTTNQSGTNKTFIIKYNSSLSPSLTAQFNDSSNNTCYGITIDSSENVYVCGFQNTPAINFVLKVNSSLAVQWSTYTNQASSSFYPKSLAIDSSGNLYFNIQASDSVGYAFFSFNSSGAVRWARSYKPAGGVSASPTIGTISISGSSFIFNGGFDYFLPTSLPLFFGFGKMPTDGTKTGTYTIAGKSFTYAAYSTGTITTGAMSASGGALTGSSTITYPGATVSSSTTTYTSTVIV